MTEIEKIACDFSFRGWPPDLWLSPLDVRRELNRDDTEIVSYWWGLFAPGRLDRVLESSLVHQVLSPSGPSNAPDGPRTNDSKD
ncbi:MAG: hypothetical protein ACXWPK_10190 [Isosphaeraceae bacterium]